MKELRKIDVNNVIKYIKDNNNSPQNVMDICSMLYPKNSRGIALLNIAVRSGISDRIRKYRKDAISHRNSYIKEMENDCYIPYKYSEEIIDFWIDVYTSIIDTDDVVHTEEVLSEQCISPDFVEYLKSRLETQEQEIKRLKAQLEIQEQEMKKLETHLESEKKFNELLAWIMIIGKEINSSICKEEPYAVVEVDNKYIDLIEKVFLSNKYNCWIYNNRIFINLSNYYEDKLQDYKIRKEIESKETDLYDTNFLKYIMSINQKIISSTYQGSTYIAEQVDNKYIDLVEKVFSSSNYCCEVSNYGNYICIHLSSHCKDIPKYLPDMIYNAHDFYKEKKENVQNIISNINDKIQDAIIDGYFSIDIYLARNLRYIIPRALVRLGYHVDYNSYSDSYNISWFESGYYTISLTSKLISAKAARSIRTGKFIKEIDSEIKEAIWGCETFIIQCIPKYTYYTLYEFITNRGYYVDIVYESDWNYLIKISW